jgi:branched-chain amino acid aminotransferase
VIYTFFKDNFFDQNLHQFDNNSRLLRYGDGIFESIKIINGKAPLLQLHIQRLFTSAQKLEIEISHLSDSYIETQFNQLCKLNNVKEGGRARIILFRNASGTYLPENNKGDIFIECSSTQDNEYQLAAKGLVIDIYQELKKPINFLSNLKTCNSLLYVMASIYQKKNNVDNVILLNDNHNVSEASNSNIYIVSNGVVYTPPLSEACIDGVMRKFVLQSCKNAKITAYENILKPNDLIRADEVFLSNASRGIQWVASYKSKRYFNTVSQKLLEQINNDLQV